MGRRRLDVVVCGVVAGQVWIRRGQREARSFAGVGLERKGEVRTRANYGAAVRQVKTIVLSLLYVRLVCWWCDVLSF